MRVNVWIPDELQAAVRAACPDLNVSQVLQDALRERIACRHELAVCGACAVPLDPWSLANDRLDRFYNDLLDALDALMQAGGTVEGACRVAKDRGERAQIPVLLLLWAAIR